MLKRLIVASVRSARTGANYVRQRLSIQEHFRRGNAPAESVVAGQAVGQREEATQKRLLCLGEQRHLDRALSAAQNRAKRDDQEFVEIVKSRVPGSRIIQFLPACHKLFQYRLQRLDSRLQR